jgi:hypothetical protein
MSSQIFIVFIFPLYILQIMDKPKVDKTGADTSLVASSQYRLKVGGWVLVSFSSKP